MYEGPQIRTASDKVEQYNNNPCGNLSAISSTLH
jgi:hypothetical protein